MQLRRSSSPRPPALEPDEVLQETYEATSSATLPTLNGQQFFQQRAVPRLAKLSPSLSFSRLALLLDFHIFDFPIRLPEQLVAVPFQCQRHPTNRFHLIVLPVHLDNLRRWPP